MAYLWTPDAEQVHAEIPTRNNGQPFDATSHPTADQVDALAATTSVLIVGEVGVIPEPVDDETQLIVDLAHAAATLGTASRVEYKHFPEQQGAVSDEGEGAALYGQFRMAVESLKAALDKHRGVNRQFTGSMRTHLPAVAALRFPDVERLL